MRESHNNTNNGDLAEGKKASGLGTSIAQRKGRLRYQTR
jgi:hypothetical protein